MVAVKKQNKCRKDKVVAYNVVVIPSQQLVGKVLVLS
ncbi:hypothetical protein ABH942_001409 [Flavobacterium sp. 28YEA47A]